MGASRFYVYDDGGTGPTPACDVLQDLIEKGVVLYKDTHKHPKRQLANYQRCLTSHRHQHQWLAFLDVDEFIVIDEEKVSIPLMLSNYKQYGGVGLNWVMFGSSGYDQRPEGGVRNYTMCNRSLDFTSLTAQSAHDPWRQCDHIEHNRQSNFPDNRHVKTIVNTAHVTKPGDRPHYFYYSFRKFCVNTDGRQIKGACVLAPTTVLCGRELTLLRHCYTRVRYVCSSQCQETCAVAQLAILCMLIHVRS
eukprot:20192-Heterococcus_DN1.PRE.3